jgi:hypothetical protein
MHDHSSPPPCIARLTVLLRMKETSLGHAHQSHRLRRTGVATAAAGGQRSTDGGGYDFYLDVWKKVKIPRLEVEIMTSKDIDTTLVSITSFCCS